jgi:hypothetical protein
VEWVGEAGLSGDDMNDADEDVRIAARDWCCWVVRDSAMGSRRSSSITASSLSGRAPDGVDGVENGFLSPIPDDG